MRRSIAIELLSIYRSFQEAELESILSKDKIYLEIMLIFFPIPIQYYRVFMLLASLILHILWIVPKSLPLSTVGIKLVSCNFQGDICELGWVFAFLSLSALLTFFFFLLNRCWCYADFVDDMMLLFPYLLILGVQGDTLPPSFALIAVRVFVWHPNSCLFQWEHWWNSKLRSYLPLEVYFKFYAML